MQAKYVDAHCHVQFDQYAHDEEEVIGRMKEDGVVGIVTGVDRASSKRAIALAQMHENLYAAVGLHPNVVAQEPFDAGAFRELARHPKVVAIGECGLDYYRPAALTDDVKRAQHEALRAHIALAAELDKPLVLHVRPTKKTQDAYEDVIAILREAKAAHPKLRGDIHFFVGGVAEAEALTALDCTLSFTAVITFAREYHGVVKAVPLASILSETDAPYVAPVSRRGERNDPLAVEEVVAKIASIRGEDPEIVRKTLVENAIRVFGLPGTTA